MLTLICGMPRAGKTTYSMKFENVIHLDELGYRAVKDKVSNIVDDVVVEGIYNNASIRMRLAEAYKGQGRKCIWLDTPLEVRKKRPMWHPTEGMIFEPPTLDEGWDEIIVL